MTIGTATSASFRQRALRGDTLLGAFLNLASPLAAELCARAGFDWLLVDLEHGAGTEADLLPVLTAIETTSTAALVRPASGERLRIGRALDFGAAGIMVPRLETVEEVREAVSYLRYPPDGVRGVALLTRGARFGTVSHGAVRSLNDEVLGVFQIESAPAVRNVREIAAIDGVDVLFVGPSDLSHSLGIPGQMHHPDYLAALDAVLKAAQATGKSAGILLRQPADLERHLELGFRFVGIGSDGGFVVDAASAALATAAAVATAR
jgi:2-keto-3-deoxy-L-rhamnonate aldolase RhmA